MRLSEDQRKYFRDELREARASILADSEAYAAPLQALERLGRYLERDGKSLYDYHESLCRLAAESEFADELPKRRPEFHRPFGALLATVKDYRNDVMHVGARARHLTTHAVEVCLILEDALQSPLDTVADFMVSDPVSVARWQPVSVIRQRMLEHSFTFIPIRPNENEGEPWILVADHQLARFLQGSKRQRLKRLAMCVEDAVDTDSGGTRLGTSQAITVPADMSIDQVRDMLGDHPLLVTSSEHVVGIITAFDLL